MAEGILFGIAEEVLKNLGSMALKEIALAWGFKDRLEKLKDTINTIKNVLLDAEEKQVDSLTIKEWLERLATAVHSADDLFDEVATVASQKKLKGGNKVIKEVHTFFSRSNQIVFAFSISQKIKSLREKLDDIVNDNAEFGQFAERLHWEGSALHSVRGREETFSDVDSNEIIGREDDKKAILDLLFASSENDDEVTLQVIPIVGMGGQGKTALAQLIYNDPQVENYFSLRLWVCVSDDFDIKIITEKIIKSATRAEPSKLELDQLRGQLRDEIGGKRYLLILDDVWNEDREEWLKLMAPLKVGGKGSKILVTTRSTKVATKMGTVIQHDLQGLKEETSLKLFQQVAFKPGQHHQNLIPLMEIGKEIVNKCGNLPLAIRAVASLLYGEDETMWLSVKNNKSLANVSSNSQNSTLDILKFSYHQLPSPLKNCFAYCSLFPKGYEFRKETLIDLWLAEGFVIPNKDEGRNLEQLAEDYFRLLLQRCFFQDIKKNKWGEITSCKMHDLIHDLALQVAGVKCQVITNYNDTCSNKGTHHLSFDYLLTSSSKIPNGMLNLKLLRTVLFPQQTLDQSPLSKSIFRKLISSFRCMRVLDLHETGVQSLPTSIGKQIHLRYLDLSYTSIKELPNSILNLQNLQTLNLHSCWELTVLPKNMRKLYNLRSLDVGCFGVGGGLIHMPPRLGELTSLSKLPEFIVNHKDYAKLGDLKTLNSIKGQLCIKIEGEVENPLLEAKEANLEGKHGIIDLNIIMKASSYDDDGLSRRSHDEDVLEGLKPHPNLKKLTIDKSMGGKLPSWVMNNLCTNLPNLVEVHLEDCDCLQQLPCFRELPSLKRLIMRGLKSVEYIDTITCVIDHSLLFNSSSTFFPSLEELELWDIENLKGWWKGGENINAVAKGVSDQLTEQRHLLSMSFSKLSKLCIQSCPELEMIPLCPNVEELTLLEVNKVVLASKIVASVSTSKRGSKLKQLTVSNAEDLKSIPSECLQQLREVNVQYDDHLVSADEVSIGLSSSLRTLLFYGCNSLRYLGQDLKHLTALEKLVLSYCQQLELPFDEQIPWKSFKSLRHLEILNIPKVTRLPRGLQHLVDLYRLDISNNYEMEELPEWIGCFRSLGYLSLSVCPNIKSLPDSFHKLTTLNRLIIFRCQGLTERCSAPNGIDWPKIQHIPFVSVGEDIIPPPPSPLP